MTLALDTNAYTALALGDSKALDIVTSASELLLPVIVLGELHQGFRLGSQYKRNLARLNEFLEKSGTIIGEVDDQTAKQYAEIILSLRAKGKPMPANDIWIAAICLCENASLLTANRHFDHIENLNLVALP